jgi:protoheme IX farnesyltransferase
MNTALATSRLVPLVSDLVALTKPRVTALVMATAAVGMGMAPGHIGWARALAMFGTTALLVGAANALNCWLERDTDVFMKRTAGRPLPARRLEPQVAFAFAAVMALASLPLLTLAINPMTGLLGALALWSYVWLYTPLKYRSPHAMIVGAVPGALPPLMGWTAVTGRLEPGGLALFGILFIWQMPHVIGLSVYRRHEYEKAGIRVLPLVHGPKAAQRHAIAWALLMLPVSLAPIAFGLGGWVYAGLAVLLGAAYAGSTLLALTRPDESVDRWGRRVFFTSLLYLPLLLTALVLARGV